MHHSVIFTPEALEASRDRFDVAAEVVSIIGVFYGGQDYETVLQSDLDNE